MEKHLFLLRGLPGNGKTTVAETIGSMFSENDVAPTILAADDYFTDPLTGEYTFDASKLKQAHESCQFRTALCMKGEVEHIIVHNTFTTKKEMKPYFDLATKYGYMVHSLIVENRHGHESVHGVPESTMEKMEQRFDIRLRNK